MRSKRHGNAVSISIITALALALPGIGKAQNTLTPADSLKQIELKEVVVTAPYKVSPEMPVTYKTIDEKAIRFINFGQEPVFILGSTPSVTFHSDAGSYMGYSYFRLRGIDQTRINMTLNGVPLNEPEDQAY